MRNWIQDTCTTILISQVDAAFCKGLFESFWCFSHIWAGIYMFRVLTSGVLLVFDMPDVEHIHYRAFLYSQIVAKFLSQGQEQASKFQCRDHAPVMFCCSAECPEASHSLVEPPKRAPSTKYDHDNFNLVHLPNIIRSGWVGTVTWATSENRTCFVSPNKGAHRNSAGRFKGKSFHSPQRHAHQTQQSLQGSQILGLVAFHRCAGQPFPHQGEWWELSQCSALQSGWLSKWCILYVRSDSSQPRGICH